MSQQHPHGRLIAEAMLLGSAPDGEERDYTPAVYGALLVTTLIAAQWHATLSGLVVAASLLISVVVFWLTHVWSGLVNRRLRGPTTRADVTHQMRLESPMLASLILPTAVLLVGQVLGVDAALLIDLALVTSIAQLFVWGLAVGRTVHTSWALAIRVATIDCLLGIAIVVLKVFVLH